MLIHLILCISYSNIFQIFRRCAGAQQVSRGHEGSLLRESPGPGPLLGQLDVHRAARAAAARIRGLGGRDAAVVRQPRHPQPRVLGVHGGVSVLVAPAHQAQGGQVSLYISRRSHGF